MITERIQKILDKYYRGNTNIEEEKELKHFFSNNVVPDDYETEKTLFAFLSEEKKDVLSESELDHMINGVVEKAPNKQRDKIKKLLVTIYSVAAGLLILFATYFVFFRQWNEEKKLSEHDTYENPTYAYDQAKKTLMFISENLNKGNESIEEFAKLNENLNHLKMMKNFNDGLQKVKPVKNLQELQKDREIEN